MLKSIPDDSAPEMGFAEEYELRRIAIEALKEVEQIAPPPAVAGIGHNQPPEGIDDEAGDIRTVAHGIRTELEVEKPRIPVVKRLTGQLGKITGATVTWSQARRDV
jgi:hypothetical protein